MKTREQRRSYVHSSHEWQQLMINAFNTSVLTFMVWCGYEQLIDLKNILRQQGNNIILNYASSKSGSSLNGVTKNQTTTTTKTFQL